MIVYVSQNIQLFATPIHKNQFVFISRSIVTTCELQYN